MLCIGYTKASELSALEEAPGKRRGGGARVWRWRVGCRRERGGKEGEGRAEVKGEGRLSRERKGEEGRREVREGEGL